MSRSCLALPTLHSRHYLPCIALAIVCPESFVCDCTAGCWLLATLSLHSPLELSLSYSTPATPHQLETRRIQHYHPHVCGYALFNERIRARLATGRAVTGNCALDHHVCNLAPPTCRPHSSLASHRHQRNYFLRTETLAQSRQDQTCRPRRHLLDHLLARCLRSLCQCVAQKPQASQ